MFKRLNTLNYLQILLIVLLLNGCTPTTQQCARPMPLPDSLTNTLTPLIEAESTTQILNAHMANMEAAGICYIQYNGLLSAIKARESAK